MHLCFIIYNFPIFLLSPEARLIHQMAEEGAPWFVSGVNQWSVEMKSDNACLHVGKGEVDQ